MTDPLDLFLKLRSADGRLTFHTQKTAEWIPQGPGCYAWFLPLWLYSDDLPRLKRILRAVHTWDARNEEPAAAAFTWEQVTFQVKRKPRELDDKRFQQVWKRVMAAPERKQALQRLLLESTPLMPPLYIGRTQNLHQRYHQHVKGSGFHFRFEQCVRDIAAKRDDFNIAISDLLFACLETSHGDRKALRRLFPGGQRDLNELIEHLLMEPCRPPFSLQ